MYEERKEKFSFKSFFLTLLLVLLFVFLMLWLFPTKNYVNNLQSTYDLQRLEVLYDEIFANNVGRMKDAAIGYFTNERMPKVVGEKKKLTLQQMYDLHLVLKMKDKNGEACDVNKSYVEMTKFTEEYRLKVNLSCGDQEDYIIVYLGCYNYCSGGVCEKQVSTPSDKTKEEEKLVDPTPTPEPTPDPTPVVKNYMYEYKLITEGCTTCTNWSAWQKDVIKETANVQVDTKTEKELTGYKNVDIQTGTKTETVVVGTKEEKKIIAHSSKLIFIGTKQIQIGTTTQEVTEKVKVGTVEVYSTSGFGTTIPNDTATTKYKRTGSTEQFTCSNCATEIIYTWDVYKVEDVFDVVTTTKEVPVYKTINQYEEQTVPVYEYRTVEITEERTTPIIKTIKVPEYKNVTYYRSKTCTKTQDKIDIKWSYTKIDSDLIGSGYKLTGNVKEV